MNIQIGTSYRVSPSNENCFIEWTTYGDDRSPGTCARVDIRTVWGRGSLLITPTDEDEVDMLQEMLQDREYVGAIIDTQFLEVELDRCEDEFRADVSYRTFDPDEDADAMLEEIEDYGVLAWIEQEGLEVHDGEYIMEGPFVVEEA
jgi:hypothetical protein